LIITLLSLSVPGFAADPPTFEAKSVTLDLPARGGPDSEEPLPIRVSWPEGADEAPVIVWSHGLGGSRDKYEALVRHWVEHGFVVLQASHQDRERLEDLKGGDTDALDDRPKHVTRMLDEVDWIVGHVDGLDPGEIDPERIGVAGHSAGAHTAMLIGGLTLYPPGRDPVQLADARADALLLISPQGTGPAHEPRSFATIDEPVLVVTGSKDDSKKRNEPASWRMEAWENLPPDHAWLLYIDGADHGMGGISRRPGEVKGSDILAWIHETTLQFWRAQLMDDPAAATWMDGNTIGKTSRGKARLEHKKPL
jgi:predicted dienelactone hydrolase